MDGDLLLYTDRQGQSNSVEPSWMVERQPHCSCTKYFKKQSSMPGFQDTRLGQSMCFEIQKRELIQILHDGHGHWLTVSGAITENGEQEMHVYNSMYATVGTYTKKQIA